MIPSIIILIAIFIGIAANINDIRKCGNLFKVSLFSIILGLLGIIGGGFIEEAYLISLAAFSVLIICLILWLIKFILGFNMGKNNTLITLSIVLIIVFELLAKANNTLDMGKEYVILMISCRNIFIIITLLTVIVKAFRMIFTNSNNEETNDSISE